MSMQTMIEQMQVMAGQAGQQASKTPSAKGTGGFGQALQASLDRINHTGQVADAKTKAFEMGTSDIPLYDVMISQQKASISLQMGIQVRNKLVGAYKEIMNMQV